MLASHSATIGSAADASPTSPLSPYRVLGLLLAAVALCLVTYSPVHGVLKSSGDVGLYARYGDGVLRKPHAFPAEYPPAAAALFVLPVLVPLASYGVMFAAMAAAALAAILVGVDAKTRRGPALFLLMAVGCFGVLFSRYDIFVVLLTVYAFTAAATRRWALAQILVVAAAALKLYPLLLIPLICLWEMRDKRGIPRASLIAAAVALLVVGGLTAIIAAPAFCQMLAYHRDRPFEVGSIPASLLWLAGNASVDFSYVSYNIHGSPRQLLAVCTMLSALLPLVAYWLFWRGRISAGPAFALVLLFLLAVTKVFSPQYLMWVLPFVVFADSESRTKRVSRDCSYAIWLGISVLTSLEYPIALENLFPIMASDANKNAVMLIVTMRNVLWIVACCVGMLRWLQPAEGRLVAHDNSAP